MAFVNLDRIEEYYDAVPRSGSRAEDFGALTLFVRQGEGWPYYARPTRGWTGAITVADVDRVRARQRELEIPESFEWVAETSPGCRAAAQESGLVVHEHALMVLGSDPLVRHPVPDGVSVRIVGPDDPALPSALAVAELAFAEPGTGIGAAGVAELAEAVRARADDGSVERMAVRIRTGLTVVGVATAADGTTAWCSGQHQPVGAVSEIVGVATLPAARRHGLALAVTASLITDARSNGVEIVFLSAADDDVARIYARSGFRRVATALIAEPAGGGR